ncbi:MAG: pyridoxine 5'-phosphate synthase [Gemmatimonadota bacterium]
MTTTHAPRLYINIDHVATVREARKTDEPDPLEASRQAEAAGADGITAHLREDRRHIQDRDVEALARAVTTAFNLELAATRKIVDIAARLAPYQATLVPERREEITTEGGLNLEIGTRRLQEAILRLSEAGCRVSLFIDPDAVALARSRDLGVAAVELHTGRYAHTWRESTRALDELASAAVLGRSMGLAVHAGHGLTYDNVQAVARIAEIEELNIGHSVISRAVFVGIGPATIEMGRLVREARGGSPA